MKNPDCHDNSVTLPAPALESLRALVDYVYQDEKRSFEEGESHQKHIFEDVLILEAWLATQD
jgi:hypothetical protein